MIKLNILGCYSATPRTISQTTAQVLEINNELFLIDCGEGTQIELRRHKIKFGRINHIFISHLHGDHFFGLVGLVSSFTLLNRQNDLHIYGPKGIKDIILLQLKLSQSYTSFRLYFHELTSTESQKIYEDQKVIVKTIPLKHRVYTNGFLFEEKKGKRKLNLTACEKYGIEICYYNKIKEGGSVTLEDGNTIPNELLSFEPEPTQSYAFCSDTLYTESIVPIIENVTILYHESTFLEKDVSKCVPTMHSTALQAAKIAKLAKAKYLILGHYSTRYQDLNLFLEEAQQEFSNVLLAKDGEKFVFKK